MRAVIQRVSEASVTVDDEVVGQIEEGLLVFVGVAHTDSRVDATALAAKIVDLRIFADDHGRPYRSVRHVGGATLVVSQFTLHADTTRGRRPSFTEAASSEIAEPLIAAFVEDLRAWGVAVEEGRFGAMMEVNLRNSGPFTLIVETRDGRIVST